MSKADFRIEWEGLDEFQKLIKEAPKKFDRLVKEELTDIGLVAEGYAKGLSPRDSGDLENSIFSTKASKSGGVHVVYVGTNMVYARYVHELFNPMGRGDKYERGVKYPNYYIGGRGKRTREKPNIKGYRAGRKYLRNAIVLTEPEVEKAMERVITKMMEG